MDVSIWLLFLDGRYERLGMTVMFMGFMSGLKVVDGDKGQVLLVGLPYA